MKPPSLALLLPLLLPQLLPALSIVALSCYLLLTGCRSDRKGDAPQHESKPEATAITPSDFDSQHAFRYLVRQTDFGPRVPGSKAHALCLAYLTRELRSNADTVFQQQFSVTQPKLGRVDLTNIMARFGVSSSKRIVLTAHWDSRPWADSDPDPKRHDDPVPGANDGASGVAVLLEIARTLKSAPPAAGVDIVLFDGEDMGTQGNLASWCTGSKYFTKHLPKNYAVLFGINLDMVGDTYLSIPREQKSDSYANDVMNLVYSTAKQLKVSQFVDVAGDDVYDDHVPMNEAGIKTIDLIDFNYVNTQLNYWHTVDDTPDKCSAESLGAVGTVLLHLVHMQSSFLEGTP